MPTCFDFPPVLHCWKSTTFVPSRAPEYLKSPLAGRLSEDLLGSALAVRVQRHPSGTFNDENFKDFNELKASPEKIGSTAVRNF